jgi:HPt (histidine-containing phosphotransfer) domain-containing protein
VDELPILDRTRLELITRGNTALADEFLGALFVEAAELITRAEAAIADGDRVGVSGAAHTLKGLATELGAHRMRAAAAALEAEVQPALWHGMLERINASLAELHVHVKP